MIINRFLTEPGWLGGLSKLFESEPFLKLEGFIEGELARGVRVYPTLDNVFYSLNILPPERVRVVILGQDPYHGPGQAHGLCFSVPMGLGLPPSLVNIYKELESDLGRRPQTGNLTAWAEQGVLLLNTVLTVTEGQAGSHQNRGWEQVTDQVISMVSASPRPVVFLLWGSFAKAKKGLIDLAKNQVLEAPHPSPLSAHRGFFGCRHFSKTNQFLVELGEDPIEWA